MARSNSAKRLPLSSGPNFTGVDDTPEHFGGNARTLQRATNTYIADPQHGSNVFAREGFTLANPEQPLPGRGQGVFTHVRLDGYRLNVIAQAGRLYRTDSFGHILADITPIADVAISSTVTRVYFWSFLEFLIVNDGVHPPWVADDLDATPITGTYIDIDGSGTPWAAYGRPTEYGGCLHFVYDNIGGVPARNTFTHSSPGDPFEGYRQPDFDYDWTLKQTGTSPLYALWGTNEGLYYFRETSIGLIVGTPGPNFESTHTSDAISANVGCLQSATIDQYLRSIFFCDAKGQPHRLPLGGAPEPIYLQLRSVIAAAPSTYNSATAQVACGVIDPTTSRYHVAVWSSAAGTIRPPTFWLVFDCRTGRYLGTWYIRSGSTVEAIGYLNNGFGSSVLVVLGNDPGPQPAELLVTSTGAGIVLSTGATLGMVAVDATRVGCVWVQGAVVGDGRPILTQSRVRLLTQDRRPLLTENTVIAWNDSGTLPEISATTQRLGESEDAVLNLDVMTVIAGSNAPILATLQTPNDAALAETTATPLASQDGSYRSTMGLEGMGRGPQLTIRPTTAATQWSLEKITGTAVVSRAGPDDA